MVRKYGRDQKTQARPLPMTRYYRYTISRRRDKKNVSLGLQTVGKEMRE